MQAAPLPKLSEPEFVKPLKKGLLELHKIRVNDEMESLKSIQMEVQKNKDMLDKLMDKLLTGVISDEVYAEKQAELISKRNHLEAREQELKQVSTNFTEITENLIELCKEVPQLYLQANEDKKKQLLKLVISNPTLDGKKPLILLNPVFENIQKVVNVKNGGLSSTKLTLLAKELLAECKNTNNILFFETVQNFLAA